MWGTATQVAGGFGWSVYQMLVWVGLLTAGWSVLTVLSVSMTNNKASIVLASIGGGGGVNR